MISFCGVCSGVWCPSAFALSSFFTISVYLVQHQVIWSLCCLGRQSGPVDPTTRFGEPTPARQQAGRQFSNRNPNQQARAQAGNHACKVASKETRKEAAVTQKDQNDRKTMKHIDNVKQTGEQASKPILSKTKQTAKPATDARKPKTHIGFEPSRYKACA